MPERAGETKDLLKIICDIFEGFNSTLLKDYKTIENYPLWNSLSNTDINSEEKNCDEIFCKYLREVAEITNPEYFATVMKFVILYRECINKYAWIKFERQEKPEQYAQTNDAEFIPELANELVLSYLSEHDCTFPVIECINLTMNFCEWLVINGYTCMRIIKDY